MAIDLVRVDLVAIDLVRVDLVAIGLVRVDLMGIDLVRVDLVAIGLVRVDLVGIDLVTPRVCKSSEWMCYLHANNVMVLSNFWYLILVPCLCKITYYSIYLYLARNFHNWLLEEINRRNPISNNQRGFSQRKSTIGALLTVVDNWHQSLEAKMDVCAVFFD